MGKVVLSTGERSILGEGRNPGAVWGQRPSKAPSGQEQNAEGQALRSRKRERRPKRGLPGWWGSPRDGVFWQYRNWAMTHLRELA